MNPLIPRRKVLTYLGLGSAGILYLFLRAPYSSRSFDSSWVRCWVSRSRLPPENNFSIAPIR
jgi:hypothetical protein